MATSLIDSMAADFDPDLYSDDYREALQEVIDAKVGGREIVAQAEAPAKPTAAVDLMAALKASVDRARAARGEAPSKSAKSSEPTPITSARSAKKAAASAEPAPAKKTAAKKAPAAKKTAAKKAAPAAGAAKKTTAAAAKKTAAKKTVRKTA
jgi:DNA end-binding protein Ku